MTTLHKDTPTLFPLDLYTLLQDQVIIEKSRQKSLLLELSAVGWSFVTSQSGVKEVIVQHKIRGTLHSSRRAFS